MLFLEPVLLLDLLPPSSASWLAFYCLVTTLGGLPLVNLVLNSQVNTFLSSFLVALERVVPGSAGSIGSSIPSTATGLFNLLGLGTILSLLGLLGAL
ncbi:hypothetical protein C8Q75DRAFT_82144 [Abortiporus biennis]|nr:hypothetical protein C8Q75DRAFT_82144 [Abortiporus biennis]